MGRKFRLYLAAIIALLTVIVLTPFIWPRWEALQEVWRWEREQRQWAQVPVADRLRLIAAAQEQWRTHNYDGNGVNDYAADFSDLYQTRVNGQPITLIPKLLADADDDGGGNGVPCGGFLFDDLAYGGDGKPFDYRREFAVAAWTGHYGESNQPTYIINAAGEVWVKHDAWPLSGWPADPQAEGWRRCK